MSDRLYYTYLSTAALFMSSLRLRAIRRMAFCIVDISFTEVALPFLAKIENNGQGIQIRFDGLWFILT